MNRRAAMAGSSLVGFHSCTASQFDHNHVQLQLMVPPETAAVGVAAPLCLRRMIWPRTSVVGATEKPKERPPFSHCRVDNENTLLSQISCCGNPQQKIPARVCVVRVGKPLLDRCEGASVMQNTHGYQKRRNHAVSIICATAKPMLEHRSSDGNDAIDSHKSMWRQEVFAELQRALLETQWALQSAESLIGRKGSFSIEDLNSNMYSQQPENAVIRSGQASARQRRLSARLRADATGSHRGKHGLDYSVPASKRKKGRVKLDSPQNFVSYFLRPAQECELLTKDQEQGLSRQMRICQSLEKAKKKLHRKLGYDPPCELWAHSVNLSTEELLSLVNKGEIARNKMLLSNLRLVVAVAKHYRYLGVDMADLIQEGSKGLLRGLEKFDHRKGYRISTYVHWWIRQGMTRAIADHSRLMRVPVYLHEIMFAIKGAKASLINQGKPVTVENLSLLLNVPTCKIERALQANSKLTSLDRSNNSYGLKAEFNGLHEFVADQNRENEPLELLNEDDMKDNVRNLMTLLTSRERDIIRWSFGVDVEGGAQSTLTSVGQKLGISKERVGQLRSSALSKMRLKEESQ